MFTNAIHKHLKIKYEKKLEFGFNVFETIFKTSKFQSNFKIASKHQNLLI